MSCDSGNRQPSSGKYYLVFMLFAQDVGHAHLPLYACFWFISHLIPAMNSSPPPQSPLLSSTELAFLDPRLALPYPYNLPEPEMPPNHPGTVPELDPCPKDFIPSIPTSRLSIQSKENAVARVAFGRRGNPFQPDGRNRAVDDRADMSVLRSLRSCNGNEISPDSTESSRVDVSLPPSISPSDVSLSRSKSTNGSNSYEAILLAPGENKIDVEIDTREFPHNISFF